MTANTVQNPFAANKATGKVDYKVNLLPEDRYQGRIVSARKKTSNNSGQPTWEIQFRPDVFDEQDLPRERVLYKYLSPHGNGLPFTAAFLESLGYDMEEVAQREVFDLNELVDRRCEAAVYTDTFAGVQRNKIGLLEGTEDTREQEELLRMEAEFAALEADGPDQEPAA